MLSLRHHVHQGFFKMVCWLYHEGKVRDNGFFQNARSPGRKSYLYLKVYGSLNRFCLGPYVRTLGASTSSMTSNPLVVSMELSLSLPSHTGLSKMALRNVWIELCSTLLLPCCTITALKSDSGQKKLLLKLQSMSLTVLKLEHSHQTKHLTTCGSVRLRISRIFAVGIQFQKEMLRSWIHQQLKGWWWAIPSPSKDTIC